MSDESKLKLVLCLRSSREFMKEKKISSYLNFIENKCNKNDEVGFHVFNVTEFTNRTGVGA